jgi:ATP-dependent helicase HrpA
LPHAWQEWYPQRFLINSLLAFPPPSEFNLGMEFQPPQRHAPKHPRFDAIHRALLTGFLSNVGTKSDTYEYLGTRGTRFSIFPGSGQFSQKPKWLVAGELVETTKLYARTCAAVQPQWIERAASHLVERTYSEPRWDARTASVIATEKVSLYGLVLIPARIVPYGPINSKISRELFLHHGLVLGEMRMDASFVRHNAALIAHVETLEAKIRQRNLLADFATRYAFYDARIPLHIHNGAQFDTWRRTVEKQNPRLLFMSEADLLRADAPAITADNFPDRLRDPAGGLQLPLTYRFEPGETHDGLTLRVPIAALPQLRPGPYEWLVPGMLEEKIAGLLRALPGSLRRSFVPVPEWAKLAAAALRESQASAVSSQSSLRDALAHFLATQTSTALTAADLSEEALPAFLKMNFQILDDHGHILGTSRDLAALQRKLAPYAAGAFATLHDRRYHQNGLTAWTIGDIPESITLQRYQMTITAYPALVDERETAALRLFPSREAADFSHRAGVRRLFQIAHRREVKGLANALPDYGRMALQYYLLGPTEELKQDLATLIVDRALFDEQPVPRTQAAFARLLAIAAVRLSDTAERVARLVGDTLRDYHQVSLLMDETYAARGGIGAMGAALADVHDQLIFLLPRHFLLGTPYTDLENFPRYLTGMRTRLQKLFSGGASILDRDLDAMAAVAGWWNRYLARKEQHGQLNIDDPELTRFRWMLEEFRIARFAQELGTVIPISDRRLEKQWEKVRK